MKVKTKETNRRFPTSFQNTPSIYLGELKNINVFTQFLKKSYKQFGNALKNNTEVFSELYQKSLQKAVLATENIIVAMDTVDSNNVSTISDSEDSDDDNTRPAPIIVNGIPYWEIQIIMDKRHRGLVPEYLVKWRGYPPEENSWEPVSSFHFKSLDCIRAYEYYMDINRKIQETTTIMDCDFQVVSHSE